VLGDLLNQLLQENNLFDLSQVLNSAEGCNKLFIVLSSTIDKEFKSLRLPDPANPSKSRMTSFLSKSDYDALEKSPLRKTACEQIAWFIIRLVTLVAALTSSVAVNTDMATVLLRGSSGPSNRTMNTTYKNPSIQLLGRESIPSDILTILVANGLLRRVKLTGTEQEDSRPLYFFDRQDSVVIDVGQSIVYMPMTSPTGVMSISMEMREDRGVGQAGPAFVAQPMPYGQVNPYAVHPQVQPQLQPGYVQQQMPQFQPQFVQQQQQRPYRANLTRNNRSTYPIGALAPFETRTVSDRLSSSGTNVMRGVQVARGGRKDRRTRKLRKARKTVGGAINYFLVTVRSLVKCEETACEPVKFYMTPNGATYDKDLYEQFLRSADRVSVPESLPFAERMRRLLGPDSKVQKVALEEPKEKAIAFGNKYSPLFERNEATFQRFQDIKQAIEHKPEGASPASYRAFLLASELDGDILNTLFCSDLWAEQRTTNTVAYSLLQSLYIDRPEGISESSTGAECAQHINQFLGAKIMKPFVPSGVSPSTFDNIAFLKTPAELAPFCKKVDTVSGKRGTKVPLQKKILTDAHKRLRELYDAQIKAVVAIVRKVLSFKNMGYRQAPVLQLDPLFMNSERGAIAALEEVIAEARALLFKHYFEVEQTYYGAISDIVKLSIGNYVPSSNAKDQLNVVANELERA
jgi:hypothetical protein